MKKLLLLFLLISNYAFAQKVIRDEVDPFNNARVRETRKTTLYQTMFEGIKQHVKSVNGNTFLIFHTGLDNVHSVSVKDLLQLMFDDSTIVSVECASGDIASSDGGNWGAVVSYKLTQEAIDAIRTKMLIAMKMEFTGGSRRFTGIKGKNSLKLREAVENVLK